MKARIGDVELAYDRAGSGDPVLLIMGLGGDRTGWERQMAALSAAYDVACFDNRGAGQSSSPEEQWTIETMAADAVGLMDRLGYQRVHLVGTSLGGCIAQEVALGHPGRVATLSLISSHHGGPEAVAFAPEVLAAVRPAMMGDKAGVAAAVRYSFGRHFTEEHPDVVEAAVAAALSQEGTAHGLKNQILASVIWSNNGGTADRLGDIVAPALVLHGGDDRMVPVRNAELLAARLPGARLRVWDEAGHNIIQELAGEVNQELLRHFAASPITA